MSKLFHRNNAENIEKRQLQGTLRLLQVKCHDLREINGNMQIN